MALNLHRLTTSQKALIYDLVLAAGGAGIWLRIVQPWTVLQSANAHLPWWVFAILEFAAWRFQIRIRGRHVSTAVSAWAAPVILGLFTTSPLELLIGCVIGFGLGDLHRKVRALWRIGFNLATLVLTIGLAVLVFRAVGSSADPRTAAAWIGTLAALAACSSQDLMVFGMLLIQREKFPSLQITTISLIGVFAAGGLALAAVEMMAWDPKAIALLFIPAPLLAVWARAAQREWEYRRAVSGLGLVDHDDPVTDLRGGLKAMLQTGREMFAARYAEVVIGDRAEGFSYHARNHCDQGYAEVAPEDQDPRRANLVDALLSREEDVDDAPVLTPPDRADIMAAALRSSGRTLGVLMVGGRADEPGPPFNAHDIEVFSLFAQQTVRALERRELDRSIRELAEREAKAAYDSMHDALTGLPNRRLLTDRLEHAFEHQKRSGQLTAVLVIDLDNLKTVNDNHGHAAGDTLIAETAHRLRKAIRASDTAGRFGGDEFAVVLEGISTAKAAAEIAGRVTAMLGQPVQHGIVNFQSTASIGVAVSTGAEDAQSLLAMADMAMYEAKRTGKNRYVVYSTESPVA